MDDQFGFMVLGGKGFIDYLTPIFSGISVPHISPQQISDFRFALPPIEEQKQIVGAILALTGDIDRALNGVEREITLIQEFRTRLIADVVTGKLDVRAVAASLPETSEPEPIDNLTEDEDLDEAVDDAENEEVAA
jgi:type I restriction enzyme S subunit